MCAIKRIKNNQHIQQDFVGGHSERIPIWETGHGYFWIPTVSHIYEYKFAFYLGIMIQQSHPKFT